MGIFDRAPAKKGQDKSSATPTPEDADYYDSPVETVSLNSAPSAGAAQPAAPRSAAPAKAAPVEDETRPVYGIEQAIQLMRAMPPSSEQNGELVVAVIKTTLESLKVKVADIIEDATKKQHDLEQRVSNLKSAIADFEKEIQQRKDEIARLEADHAETSSVKSRLELAEKSQKAQASQAPKGVAAKSA